MLGPNNAVRTPYLRGEVKHDIVFGRRIKKTNKSIELKKDISKLYLVLYCVLDISIDHVPRIYREYG